MKYITRFLLGIASLLTVWTANAAIIELRPATTEAAAPGDPVMLGLFADFGSESTIGGGIDITFNPDVLTYVTFAFDPDLHLDSFFPSFIETKRTASGEVYMVTAAFNSLFPAYTGAFKIGELSLRAATDVPPEGAFSDVTLATNPELGGFFGLTDFHYQDPAARVNVLATAVPLPPTVWMFISGLAIMGLVRLRRQASFLMA